MKALQTENHSVRTQNTGLLLRECKVDWVQNRHAQPVRKLIATFLKTAIWPFRCRRMHKEARFMVRKMKCCI